MMAYRRRLFESNKKLSENESFTKELCVRHKRAKIEKIKLNVINNVGGGETNICFFRKHFLCVMWFILVYILIHFCSLLYAHCTIQVFYSIHNGTIDATNTYIICCRDDTWGLDMRPEAETQIIVHFSFWNWRLLIMVWDRIL